MYNNKSLNSNVVPDLISPPSTTSTSTLTQQRHSILYQPSNGITELGTTNVHQYHHKINDDTQNQRSSLSSLNVKPLSDKRQSQTVEMHTLIRPTYGAYTHNTLPRGPYLQYKYNDHYSLESDNNRNSYHIKTTNDFTDQKVTPIDKFQQFELNNLNGDSGDHHCITANIRHSINQGNGERYQSPDTISSQKPKYDLMPDYVQTLGRYKRYTTTSPMANNYHSVSPSQYHNTNENSRITINSGLPTNNGMKNSNWLNNKSGSDNNYNATKYRGHVEPNNGKLWILNGSEHSNENLIELIRSLNNNLSRISCPAIAYNRPSGVASYSSVTLDDVIKLPPHGLTGDEGWALLCQSVQALQDLFLTGTPSTSRILPLVNLLTFQITSRGRVAFSLLSSAGQKDSYRNDGYDTNNKDIEEFLSPEYLATRNEKMLLFTESDIEKMWIYSLGKTLENCVSPETIVSNVPADNCQLSYECNKNNSGKSPIDLNSPVDGSGGVKSSEPYQISFDYVLAAMCEPDINQRATLMNLLDVISQHCKRHHHQSKPFSHIVVELFNRVVEFKERMARQQPIDNVIRDNTSDSDSGRCSGSTEHSCDGGRGQPQRQTIGMGLRVSRQPIQKFNSLPRVLKNIEMRPIIGSALDLPAVSGDVKTTNGMGKLHVRKRDLILKRRFGSRRNTIEVNSTEMENAMKIYKRQDGIMNGVNASKSVNCLDQIINRSDEIERNRLFNVTSMPDLNTTKIRNPLVSTLKVLRKRVISTETLADNFHIQADGVVKSKGPEFIINSSLPSKEIDLTDTKCQSRRTVNVLLLNGETIKVLCNAGQATVLQIFEAVIRSENLYENYFMGLCALIGGDFVFLPSCLKVYKVAPQLWFNDSKKLPSTDNIIFNLFLRIKFFLPELRGLCSVESRHLLYLQLRKSILESQILCTDDDLILLGGLALQAEVGDFISNMRRSEYFTISHYLPEGVYQRNREMKRYLRNSHFSKRGMHSRDAEQTFIRYVQGMREYGQHLYSAIWSSDDNINHDVYVAISLSGIALFERSTRLNSENLLENGKNPKTSFQRPVYGIFDWLEIENLCFSKHILCIVVRRSDSLEAKNNNRIKYNLKMSGRKSYFAFTLASEHHKFFMKLRNSFLTLKSISDEMNVPLKVANIQHIPSAIKTELENAAEQKKSIENGKSENDLAVENQQSTDKNRVLIEDQVKLIDKKSKGTINRVRNLKKSMLNDNKLIKLKNKFLRRNKSTTNIENVQIPNEMNESNDDNIERNISSSSLLTKEESQNKENENPTILTECFSDPILNNIEKDESNLKYLSPKRNRVKMGTRVLSSQYLNKSFDNIFDNMLDICLFDLNDSMPDLGLNKLNGRRATQPPVTTEFPNIEERTVALYSGQSMNEKHSNRMNRQESSNEMCSAKEAFILDSSIKSLTATNFSIENETISDSLLEKFNNISCSTSNTMNDRIITRLIIHKEILNEIIDGNQITDNLLKFANKVRLGTLNMSRSQESLVSSSKSLSTMQSNELLNTNKRDQNDQFTLGISIVQGSDNVVYVKDLVKNGPAEKAGVRIGDQVLAVNGISLMNKPYSESLNMLKNSGHTVELLLSQIYDNRKLKQLPKTQIPNGNLNRNIIPRNVTDNISLNSFKSTDFSIENHSIEDYLYHIRLSTDDILQYTEVKNIFSSHNQHETLKITEENVEIAQTETKLNDVPESWSKSLPDLPKIVGTIPKRKKKQPETDGYNEFDSRHPSLNGIVPKGGRHTRAYSGPIKYPVTPMRPTGSFTKPSLSIMADSKDDDIEL